MELTQIERLSEEMEACVENCLYAAQACEWCADACLDEGEGMIDCIRLCRDVADLTTLHARFMVRDSQFHRDLAGTCADACEACADECEQHDHDHCQVCAEACREAAETCREMAA